MIWLGPERREMQITRLSWNHYRIAAALALFGGVTQGASGQYTATILDTGGMFAAPHGIGGGQIVGYGPDGFLRHALLWTSSAASPTDLHPAGFVVSEARGTDGIQQVGYGELAGQVANALLWSGTAASVVNLHPAGFTDSVGEAIYGGQQAGWGIISGGQSHALLWSGTAASAVDLNPSGFDNSSAYGIYGSQQAGYGHTGGADHALLWSGTAASAVDLNPTGYNYTYAFGTYGTQQVGVGIDSVFGNTHALLWTGTAASAVDLTPAWSTYALATAVSAGNLQVGYAWDATFSTSYALAWNGTASSAINLNSFLPSNFLYAYASGVDELGNIVGFAYDDNFDPHVIVWSPQAVPEPGSMALLAGLALPGVIFLRRCRK